MDEGRGIALNDFFQKEKLKYWEDRSVNLHAFFSRAMYRHMKAFDLVIKIAQGLKAWKMSTPEEASDSDIVINSALLDIKILIGMNQKLVQAVDLYADGLKDGGELAKRTLAQLDDFIVG